MTVPETIRIATPGGQMRAHLVSPSSETALRRGVLVLHEAFGLNDDIRAIARRFAEQGYVALAPDLFSVGPPKPFCVMRTMRSLDTGSGPVFDSLDAARNWLADRDDVDPEKIAVAGFCMGGGFAILHAARAEYAAAAPYYARVPKTPEALGGICPVVGGFGAADRMVPDQAAHLRRHLDQLDVPHDIVEYDGVGHSYMNRASGLVATPMIRLSRAARMTIGYDHDASEDSWRRMLSFFDEHLGAAS